MKNTLCNSVVFVNSVLKEFNNNRYIRKFWFCFYFTNLITYNCSAQFAGGSQDGYAMVKNPDCAAYPPTPNIFKGSSQDGYAMVRNPDCAAYPPPPNIFKGSSQDGYAMVRNPDCAPYPPKPNVFIGGQCSGEFAVVSTCPAQTWTVPSCKGWALPIELLYFDAYLQSNNTVLCKWETLSEIDNDYFTIEKIAAENLTAFANLSDSKWVIVALIDGAGNSNKPIAYSTADKEPYQGVSYYRLKQTDVDGKYTYSEIRAVNLQGIDILQLSPNPAEGEISVLLYATEKTEIQVEIYNVLGQKTTKETQWVNKGLTVLQYDISNLSTGYYMFRAITTTGLYQAQKKLIKN